MMRTGDLISDLAMETLDTSDPRWLAFVERSTDASPFHHPAWAAMVADCYGFRSFALALPGASGSLSAGIPIVEVKHPLGAPRWVSLPFTDACGPLIDAGSSPAAFRSGLESAMHARGIRRLEVRGEVEDAPMIGTPAWDHHLELDSDPTVIYRRMERRAQRAIGQAQRADVVVRLTSSESDLAGPFHALHLLTRRRLGVPIQPRRFFRLLGERMIAARLGSVVIVESAGRPVAALVLLHWRDTVVMKFSASDPTAWKLRPNHLALWHAIQWACESGYRRFDFGRTDADNDGLRTFKRSFGSEEVRLAYHAIGGGVGGAGGGLAQRVLSGVIRHGPAWLCTASGELLYRYVA